MRKRTISLQRLNIVIAAVFLALALPACGWLKPAADSSKDKVYKDEDLGDIQGTKVYDPETGTYRTVHEVNEDVDTVAWKVLPAEKYPPIKTDSPMTGGTKPPVTGGNTGGGTTGGAGNGTGDISILLPFLANASSSGVPDNSLWALNFYAGARLAYDDLEEDGAKFNVSIMDSEASTSKVNSLLKSGDLPKSDLIIGPYKREIVDMMQAFSKKNKVPLVVPYTAQMGMAEDNPFYIQVNPSLKAHCEAMTKHIRRTYQPENVVLVALDKPEEKARFKYFQDANTLIEKGSTIKKFQELLVPESGSNFQTIDVTKYLKPNKTTVFVVPSWSNQTFIYSLLRQLMTKQSEGEDIVVYGMSMWLDFEQIDFEYYEKLGLHVSSASYVDKNDERVKQFKKKFFNSYGSVPDEEAFLGYDVMLYFGKMLAKHGKDFAKHLDVSPSDVLHGRFEFNPVVLNPEKHKENLKYFDQLENTYVHILKFKYFHLQPAD
ncbi:MAG: ABC transporter substrate-binding protein [Saprospiraceae bacterium]|nr:ABC transporter substrate-binding protein [Saprospiraceae bacterium]MCF8248331.1 ABC transporter substrate-binding protein [Saprospiraceae bacterium]MCF8280230.1 ABC transporter substrate-binding protein [Bacteroidales bacterium]MCF8309859.1 ABC transporter substrate-binding protein [Saprospiraceae bacterium]MCF8438810.1 ABC transporter substrate-binding protein [Saprospiraceae bacterium]